MDRAAFQWLFFDLGSTLADEAPAHADRVHQIVVALAGHGIQVTTEMVDAAFGAAAAAFAPRRITAALARLTVDPAIQAAVLSTVRYRKELERLQPAARAVLGHLAGRYQIAVVANQPAGTQRWLERFELAPVVSLCINSTEVGVAKPDPAIFRLALARAGCAAHQAVVIGDRVDNDIRPARALGLATIRVLSGFHAVQRPRDAAEQPDWTVPQLADLIPLLARMDAAVSPPPSGRP